MLIEDTSTSSKKGETSSNVFTVLKDSPENEEEGLRPDNPNGTLNGLNLLLIDNIKTEGYVKEILTIYRKSTENGLDDYEFQVPMEVKLGIQADETGLYNGTLLPKSYLPTKNGIVVWKESFDGIPAEEMTVENLNPNNAISLVGRYPEIYGQMSYNVGSDLFQGLYQNAAGTEVNGFPPSKLNWLGSSTGRPARTYYQPDGMSYLNGRLNRFVNDYFNDAEIEKFKQNLAMASITVPGTHNAGEAGFMIPLTYGCHWVNGASFTSESGYMAIESLYNDLNTSFKKYPILAKKYYGHSGRAIGAFLLCESGWSFTQVGFNYITKYGNISDEVASDLLGSGKTSQDLINYFASKVNGLPISDSEASSLYHWNNSKDGWVYYNENKNPKGFMFKYDPTKTVTKVDGSVIPFLSVMNNETLGQIYSALFQGPYIYAVALKYAGVDVDPTDPNSYLNSIPNDEWKPSGDTAWMAGFGIDASKLNSKRIAFLNELWKWKGSWYTQHNGYFGSDKPSQIPPVKDANGEWIRDELNNGFDCSGLIQYSTFHSVGFLMDRTTFTQVNASYLEPKSSFDDLLPGDLVYYYYNIPGNPDPAHVAVFLNKTSDGKVHLYHSPQPGSTVGPTNWLGDYGTDLVYRRFKVLDE